MKIERWFKRAKVGSECRNYRLLVSPDLATILEKAKDNRIRKLSKKLKLDIELVKDESLSSDKFRVLDLDQQMEVTEVFKSKR
jgi:hypothetical protein